MRSAREKVFVEQPLARAEPAHKHMLELLRHLRGHLALEAPQHEGPQHGVQPLHEQAVDECNALDVLRERAREPRLELLLAAEEVRHEKVHEAPELEQRVLQWRAGEQQAPPRAEGQQSLPALRLVVLDVVRLIKDQVVPLRREGGGGREGGRRGET